MKTIWILISIFSTFNSFAQNEFTYKLSVDSTISSSAKRLYISYEYGNIKKRDSINIEGALKDKKNFEFVNYNKVSWKNDVPAEQYKTLKQAALKALGK